MSDLYQEAKAFAKERGKLIRKFQGVYTHLTKEIQPAILEDILFFAYVEGHTAGFNKGFAASLTFIQSGKGVEALKETATP